MTNVKIPKAYEELLNIPNEFKDDAYKYCVMVLSGAYITCKDTRLACIRHLKDIHRSIENDEWNYTYKPKRARRLLNSSRRYLTLKVTLINLDCSKSSLLLVCAVGLRKIRTC